MPISLKSYFKNKDRFLGQFFQIAVALWFFRMLLPGIKYFFVPAYLVLLFVLFFYHRKLIFQKDYLFEFLKTFNPLIILGLFFLFGMLNSDKLYSKAMSDILEFTINFTFLFIFFALTYSANKQQGFTYVFRKTTRIIWISAVVVATLGLIKYSLQIIEVNLPLITPYGTVFNQDKNFFALYSMLGIIGLIPRIVKADTLKKRIFAQFFFLILLLNIVFSFSFRSLFLLSLTFLVLFFIQPISLLKGKLTETKKIARNLRLVYVILFSAVLFFIIGIKSSNQFSNKIFDNYLNEIIGNTGTDVSIISKSAFHFDKWGYAADLVSERDVLKKLFGDGFSYLESFGVEFNGNNKHIDYPHNPVMSGVLYSGFVGGIFILFFLFVSLYYGGKYFRKYPLFAMMLFMSMLFVLFSGNSLFSVPLFLFLFSLSFLIRHQEISGLNIVMNMDKPGAKFLKESFDYVLASLTLVFLSPLLIFIGLVVGFTMGWPVVFSQVRIGQNGKEFRLHKFRSMKKVISTTTVAAQEQNRITSFGKFMRKYKLDELPELWNIIRGDMSFVGPRPDVPGYADKIEGEDRVILQLKPGLTGVASLKYINEEELLSKQENPQEYNDKIIWPDKIRINKFYYENWSFFSDIKILVYTMLHKQIDI